MHLFRKYPKLFKLACLATVSCGAGWLFHQIKATQQILANALDTSILCISEPTGDDEHVRDDFLVIDTIQDQEKVAPFHWLSMSSLKFGFIKRLLFLAHSENRFVRMKAIRQLSRVKKLNDWQFSLLSNMIDARTAVALARTPNSDPRFFNTPPPRYLDHSYTMLVEDMRDLLIHLHAKSQHPCVGYFISKAFIDTDPMHKFEDDVLPFELKNYVQIKENDDILLPMCLESLLHHASVGNYAKDIAELNALPLLMEIQNRFKDRIEVMALICRIISYLSMHIELLDDLYKSGWVGLLAQWVAHEDVRISIPASKALANLDLDEDNLYLQRLYPLHPPSRVVRKQGLDVVFVHGLLGGVFFTWRQRQRGKDPVGFLGKRGEPEPETLTQRSCENCYEKKSDKKCSNPEIVEFMEDLEEHLGMTSFCRDYDVVWEDIPTNTNEEAIGPYSCPGYKYRCADDEDCFTFCWPRDWLAEDCSNLRILGVNYETNLSLWTPICPLEKVKTLGERSDELLEQLVRAGVGEKPIVWVTHSMGGLLVKEVINKAASSDNPECRDIHSNTKGIVFYSTPHLGSRVATFSQASALVIWPSVEVQELQKDSPALVNIHQKFLDLVKEHPMKIVTFVETEPTVVSAMKFKFLVVEPQSGNPGCGEYYEVPLDHLGICKPASRHSFLYQRVLNMIKEILREHQFGLD